MFITNVTNLNTASGKEIMITAVDKENSDRAGIPDNPKDKVVVVEVILKLIKMDKASTVCTNKDGQEGKDEDGVGVEVVRGCLIIGRDVGEVGGPVGELTVGLKVSGLVVGIMIAVG